LHVQAILALETAELALVPQDTQAPPVPSAAYVLTAHGVQERAPISENFPATQFVHDVCDTAPEAA